MSKVLAIAGSLRRDSFNRRLLEAAAELAPAAMTIEICDGLRALPLFDEDLELATGGGPESVRQLREDVAAADGLLIATPEYNWSIPGALKNAIDWLSRPPGEVLAGKPVAVIGATAGQWGTRLAQAALRQTLTATESLVMPAPALFVRAASGVFEENGRLQDARVRDALAEVVTSFAKWMETCSSRPSSSRS